MKSTYLKDIHSALFMALLCAPSFLFGEPSLPDSQVKVVEPALYRTKSLDGIPMIVATSSLVFIAWYYAWFRSDRGTRPENQPKICNLITLEDGDGFSIDFVDNPNPPTYFNLEYLMRDLCGSCLHCNSLDMIEDVFESDHHYGNKNPLGFLGRLEERLIRFGYGTNAITTFCSGLCLTLYMRKLQAAALYDKAKDKLYAARAYLLGNQNDNLLPLNDDAEA